MKEIDVLLQVKDEGLTEDGELNEDAEDHMNDEDVFGIHPHVRLNSLSRFC